MSALGFIVATAFWPGILSSAVAPRWVAVAILPPLLCRLDLAAIRPAFAFGLLVWVAYAALSVVWSVDKLTAGNEVFHLLFLVSVALMAAGAEDISGLLLGFSIGVSLSGILAAVQFFAGWSPVEQTIGPAGLFLNRALLAEIAAPVFVWCLLSLNRSGGTRLGWYVLLLPLAVPLVICESRVAVIATVVGLLFAYPRYGWRIAVGLAGYGLAAWFLNVLPFDPGKLASADQRFEIWRDAIAGFSPFGRGIGSFTALFPRWEYVHSDVLQAIYELGIGAVAPLVCGVMAFTAPADKPEKAALFVMAVVAAASFPLHTPAAAFLGFALAGHLAGRRAGLRSVRPLGGMVAVA